MSKDIRIEAAMNALFRDLEAHDTAINLLRDAEEFVVLHKREGSWRWYYSTKDEIELSVYVNLFQDDLLKEIRGE